MSKKEGFIKWKTVETTTPSFPDGAILIKEDTYINFFSLKKDSYDTSFIKEVYYKIDYSHQIDINYKS